MASMRVSVLIVAVLMMAVATTKVAEGQSTPSCASNLVECAGFLNTTGTPPSSCCDPLRQAVTTELTCLCNLYENPSFLTALGINVTQALDISRRCGIPGDISACRAGAPGTSPPSGPSRPGGAPGRNDGNGVGKIARTGFSSLLLLWGSLMLY